MINIISPKAIALTFGIFILSFLVIFYVVAWTEPNQTPPAGNVAAPLNIGNVGQSKAGGLILNTGGAVNALIVDKGKICFGNDCRGSWTEVAGSQITFKMTAASYLGTDNIYHSKTVSYTCPGGATASIINCSDCGKAGSQSLCSCSASGSIASLTAYVQLGQAGDCTGGDWVCMRWERLFGFTWDTCADWQKSPVICDPTTYAAVNACTSNCTVVSGAVTFGCGVVIDVTP